MPRRPINEFTDTQNNQDGTVTTRIYSYPKYFSNEQGQLVEIDTNIKSSSDNGWDWEVKNGVYKLRIKNNGTFEINHLDDILEQKIIGLGFFNQSNRDHVIKLNLDSTIPTVDGNTITWNLNSGIVYKLVYIEDTFKDILIISNKAKNFLSNNNPFGQKENIRVGLVYDIDLSRSTMIESKNFDTENDINFVKDGRIKHKILKGKAKHSTFEEPEFDEQRNLLNPDESSRIWKRRRTIKEGKLIETTPVLALDSVDGNITFNSTLTFREGENGYSGTDDAKVRGGINNSDDNFETDGLAFKSDIDDPTQTDFSRNTFIRFDISSIPNNSDVTSVDLTFRLLGDIPGPTEFYLFECLRDWVESEVTWNEWKIGSSWTTGGGRSNGNDINGQWWDGVGKLAEYIADGTESDTTITFSGNSEMLTYVEGNLDGEVNFMIGEKQQESDGAFVPSSEDSTIANRPLLTVTFTPPPISEDLSYTIVLNNTLTESKIEPDLTDRKTGIQGDQIQDRTINPRELNSVNDPTNDLDIATWDSVNEQFKWIVDPGDIHFNRSGNDLILVSTPIFLSDDNGDLMPSADGTEDRFFEIISNEIVPKE